MSLRFRKSIKLAPGVRINFNKNSVGISAGVKGARVSVNSNGRVTTSVGIPGTGLYDVETTNLSSSGNKKRVKSKKRKSKEKNKKNHKNIWITLDILCIISAIYQIFYSTLYDFLLCVGASIVLTIKVIYDLAKEQNMTLKEYVKSLKRS